MEFCPKSVAMEKTHDPAVREALVFFGFDPLSPFSPPAKDPAKKIISLARTMEDESPGSLRGIKFLGELDLGHAEARLHQLIYDWKLTVPVHISQIKRGLVTVPMIRCTTWFDYILNNKSEVLCAGCDTPESAVVQSHLSSFWGAYKLEDPNHDVYRVHGGHLHRCVPFYLYSDEGRGYRKSPVQVFAMESVFGIPNAKDYERVTSTGDLYYLDSQVQPSRGHSFNSRFLCCVMPHQMYKGKVGKGLWCDMVSEIASDCCKLFHDGVAVHLKSGNGVQQFYGICLGHKGDFPALIKAGHLQRSFQNLGVNKGMCPYCDAGQANVPWEDVSPEAAWVSTMWRTEPWSNDNVSPFRMVPCDQSRAANFYKSDPFHIFKYGIGRHFCASCIVVLCQWGYFPGSTQNIVDLLSNAHTDFRWACKNEIAHGSPHMKGFTKELFHFPRNASFPWGGWKGSDTLLLLRWLLRVLRHGVKVEGQPARPNISLTQSALDASHVPVFEAMHDATRAGLLFFRIIHQPNLWETRDDGYKLVESVELFCSAYAFLATTMLNDGLCRFHFEPSLHQYMHLGVRLRNLLQNRCIQRVLSPASFLCESGEDFIGRIARISRRAPPRNLCMRTLQRYLIKLHQVWES